MNKNNVSINLYYRGNCFSRVNFTKEILKPFSRYFFGQMKKDKKHIQLAKVVFLLYNLSKVSHYIVGAFLQQYFAKNSWMKLTPGS